MDVLYWPPFLIFTLEYYFFWRLFGGMIITIGIITFSYSRYYQHHHMRTQETKLAQALAICQILFFPIGTITGTMALKAIKKQGISFDNELKDMGIAKDYLPILQKETGKLLVASALFHEGVLMSIFILTIYFSTVMLDITYPFLVIDTIYLIRYILLGFGIFFMGELIFGWKYENICINPQYRKIGKFIAIAQLLFIPIGTYTGISLIKSLNIEYKLKK
jgi:hypothetical protein